MGHAGFSSRALIILTMFSFLLLACLLAVAVEGSYYGYDGYGGYGGYGYGGYGHSGYGYGGYGHSGYGYGSYGGYGYPYYGGYGHGYGYGGYGNRYKRSTDPQQVHVSGYAGQSTVVPTSGGYSSYAPAYYGHHASSYAQGYGYSSYAPSHYNAPYGYETYYSYGGRHPYSAGSSAYAPGYQSHGYGSGGYGNVKYGAGTPFLYNRVAGYY